MGSMSIWHWLIVLIVVLLVFGSGKISTLMGDLAKGIKIFKKNIAEDETPSSQSKTILPDVDNKGDTSVSFNDNKEKTPVSSETQK
ncbi:MULTISPECIES: twin-arginine translocase TatA/TatE family subunit [Commensalibacter]|uniref:twin-arginine translocase TatA/TatE family subunit n=1 Tax=Commensalibacter TaxID=1079922 RepID=UPI0012D92115|nr:twin-arginine translocase TatA/TatE family subunit [Commensalibacter sp. M0134]MBI0069689.1 twin-arginine translocase TatA/TatE family subunit [Commensalibacter sp. M0133]MBI0080708.1 twin-arginine translocase TatA/TatE family subunit [Commensalibacter melissae]MUG78068.1 twin-arginine translocase TatA/TatE family subunit [Commensalibacter melissae]MUH04850.1 twin-arginine translocase TatA/TatE family subunit [Commensalibacter melissae]